MTIMRGWFRSMRCALAGIGFLIRSQANARIHLVASLLVVSAGCWWRLSGVEWCWIFCAIAVVWIAESLNTAIECLADAVIPEQNKLIGRAKDVAAGGVLFAALMAAAIGACIFGPHVRALI